MQKLEMETAIAVMGIISTSTDLEFKLAIANVMRVVAEHREGVHKIAKQSCGTYLLPKDIKAKLEEEMGIDFLEKRNVISCGGKMIELAVIGKSMPDEFLINFFHFDIKECAEKQSVTLDQVEQFIKDSYRGLDGDGDYLFEFKEVDRFKYFKVLGISSFGRSQCECYYKIYADFETFGVQNIRNILFRNSQGENNDSGT